jgi:hypothetical protein
MELQILACAPVHTLFSYINVHSIFRMAINSHDITISGISLNVLLKGEKCFIVDP